MPMPPALVAAARPPIAAGRPWRALATVGGGSLAMAAAAHVAVPFWPVPLTLQTLVALGVGVTLGPAAATLAILAWIGEGVAGLPVFAAGAGPAVLLGPTGGYILGFVPAVLIAAQARRRSGRAAPVATAAIFTAADAAVFAAGLAWLATLVGWQHAVALGLTPFLLGETLKVGLATAGAALLPARGTRCR